MRIQEWMIYICDGGLAAIHGEFYPITEYYCPDLKLAVNSQTFFLSGTNRYETSNGDTEFNHPQPELVKEIEISNELANLMRIMKDGARGYDVFKKQMFPDKSER
jgi:hypothetical protein